jgi:BirA family biotin operon repressor/biotin-[acetyl-CoA-carboxylase] ligase
MSPLAKQRFPIQVFDVLPSTNDSILEAGETDAPEGTTYIARTQSRGRGRCDHAWWSPPGAGLWMSTLLRPSRGRAHWGGISLVAGVAVRDAIEAVGVAGVRLYWPNDLEVGRRKIGGILGEVRERGRRAWIALGIGINIDFGPPHVRASMPPEIERIAISLAEAGQPATTDPLVLAEVILARFWPLYGRFQEGDSVPSIVGNGLAHAGRTVEVKVPGNPSWRGRVEGLGANGELLVRPLGCPGKAAHGGAAHGGVIAVTGGEVVYEEGP